MSDQDERYEVLLSGSGGQGIILAGVIIAEAGIAHDLKVVQTASYGPESRGGASRSEVILSGTDIDYPAVTQPDFVIALTQEAADKFAHLARPRGKALLDTTWVENIPRDIQASTASFPLTEEASNRFGKPLVANIIALGYFAEHNPLMGPDELLQAIVRRVPSHYRELNEHAFAFGRELATRQ
ncbi:2-oxoacid:acceptor oxidoreductase family protein [bacterium]|nr:2-oxoacid:acceptor oxidoreductase family protein [bacterium]